MKIVTGEMIEISMEIPIKYLARPKRIVGSCNIRTLTLYVLYANVHYHANVNRVDSIVTETYFTVNFST